MAAATVATGAAGAWTTGGCAAGAVTAGVAAGGGATTTFCAPAMAAPRTSKITLNTLMQCPAFTLTNFMARPPSFLNETDKSLCSKAFPIR